MPFWDALGQLPTGAIVVFLFALVIAFAFEFINGFHDTANAVTTVIYTRTMSPTPSVIYSGILNFLGVLLGGTAVAFGIVNLLPVDVLVDASSMRAFIMVLALLIAGVTWNLGTWYFGLPVSSSHTLIGSILGVGLANSMLAGKGLDGVDWKEARKVGLSLLLSPFAGFLFAYLLLLIMKVFLRDKRLYVPPQGDDRPPGWIRAMLIATCGGVSFGHGMNDGQKGMGLILLVLIGFLPIHYALDTEKPEKAIAVFKATEVVREVYKKHDKPIPKEMLEHLDFLRDRLAGKNNYNELTQEKEERWKVRQSLMQLNKAIKGMAKNPELKPLMDDLTAPLAELGNHSIAATFKTSVEFVPFWVILGVAVALGVGTCVGYKRIVITVAEKIGKQHLTYAQGASAELVAATMITAATNLGLPLSTTQVLSSGIAGTMVANHSGLQAKTFTKILLAWIFTLPCTMMLSGLLYLLLKQIT